MRLIDADALFEALGLDQHNNGEGMTSDEEMVAEAIMTAPTIEAEPVRRGRWKRTIAYPNIIICDECGEPYKKSNSSDKWNYCPNCGAKMEMEED